MKNIQSMRLRSRLRAKVGLLALVISGCGGATSEAPASKPATPATAPAAAADPVAVVSAVASTAITLVEGQVIAEAGKSVPGGLKVVVVWVVSTGSPDYTYKFGEAPVEGQRYRVSIDATKLPDEALNRVDGYEFGVAVVAVVPASLSIPDGRFADAMAKNFVGNGRQHGILFHRGDKAERIKDKLTWFELFSKGKIQCGEGVKQAGVTFDGFKPASCDKVPVQLGKLEWVNWT